MRRDARDARQKCLLTPSAPRCPSSGGFLQQLCTRDTSKSRIYSASTVRSWRSKAVQSGLLYMQRRRMGTSISCSGCSITVQMQMLKRVAAGYRCMWQRTTSSPRPSRCYMNTTQTWTRRSSRIRLTRPFALLRTRKERLSTLCVDCWSMGPAQITLAAAAHLCYIKRRSRDGSRSFACYSVTERTFYLFVIIISISVYLRVQKSM